MTILLRSDNVAKGKNAGIGGIIAGAGIIFFILVFMLIGTLPFEITSTEQSIMYLTSVLVMLAGIVLVITDF